MNAEEPFAINDITARLMRLAQDNATIAKSLALYQMARVDFSTALMLAVVELAEQNASFTKQLTQCLNPRPDTPTGFIRVGKPKKRKNPSA